MLKTLLTFFNFLSIIFNGGGKWGNVVENIAQISKIGWHHQNGKELRYKKMAIYELSERTKKSIANCVGKPFDEICNLSLDEEITIASKKCGHKVGFSRNHDNRRIGRGSPYLAKWKFRTLEEVEKKIARIR